jgi:mannitol-specific phosphotransferase system IIBC component
MSSRPRVIPPPAPLAALCGWLVPGAGYWLLGERVRAVIIGASVLLVFAAGILLGGIRVVDAPTQIGMSALLEKPWFIGQVLIGPLSVVTAITADRVPTDRVSHGRSWEIGTLYTAIAGMLNLLAIIDAAHRAALGNHPPPGDTA